MSQELTVGQLLIDQALPPSMRGVPRTLDAKGVSALFQELAEQHPDAYRDIGKKISDIGRDAATISGGFTSGIAHLQQPEAAKRIRKEFDAKLQAIYAQHLSEDERNKQVIALAGTTQQQMAEEVYQEALANKNPIALQAMTGVRGNKMNVNSLLGADMLYADHKNQPIPLPVTRSYSMGLTPAEYMAGAFGARKGTVDLKLSTSKAGFLCLDADTLVRMADFSVKKICDISAGDMVMGADLKGNCFPSHVIALIDTGVKPVNRYDFRYGKSRSKFISITGTAEHKVLARKSTRTRSKKVRVYPDASREMAELGLFGNTGTTKCELVVAPLGEDMPLVNCAFQMATPLEPAQTYDICVDNPDHLFVLANGAIVSNSKQLNQISHRLVVTDTDGEAHDPENPRGMPVDTDNKFNAGSLLAHDVAGYKRNQILTPKILKDIKSQGHDSILVRSPIVGGPKDGGVYAYDAGVRERGGLPPIGDFVGLAGAQSIGEIATQASISSKHCLMGGTLVRMADLSVKAIEDIRVGDQVLGADMFGKSTPVKVVNTFDNGERECSQFKYQKGASAIELCSTAEHKILVVTPYGNELLAAGVEQDPLFVKLADSDEICVQDYSVPLGMQPTYDIEVDHPDHLFVLANGLIVSNSGGVVGAQAGALTGFPLFNALIQVPEVFPGGATHAQNDGRVTDIRPAPQGGTFVMVDGQEHHVHSNLKPTVNLRDMVEAGDVLSEGLPSPAEFVKHKGVGEGRRQFVTAFSKALQEAGAKHNRRNVELLARGAINHVRLTDEYGNFSPGEVHPYQTLEAMWEPRAGYIAVSPESSKNYYLEKPVLHYTIGTKIKPSMIAEMKKYGVKRVIAHSEPPPFEPEMIRGMASVSEDPDWMTNMFGSYQKSSLLDAVHNSRESDESGTSYIPALAHGKTFGISGATKGWNPKESPIKPPDFTQPKTVLDDWD